MINIFFNLAFRIPLATGDCRASPPALVKVTQGAAKLSFIAFEKHMALHTITDCSNTQQTLCKKYAPAIVTHSFRLDKLS